MSASSVYRDDVVCARGQCGFQKPIVRLVPDDAEFSQWMAEATDIHNLSDEIGPVTKHVGIFLKYGGTCPCLNQGGARQFEDQGRRVVLSWKRGEFQDAGVKNDSQGRAWRDAMPANVAWLRRTRPLPVRSWSCRGFRDARAPARERV